MSSRAAAGRKRLQTAPSTPLSSPKSRSKFSRFLSPSHSSLLNPEPPQPFIAAYHFQVPESPQNSQQLTPNRDIRSSSRKPSSPYPEAVHATSPRSPPPQHSLPPLPAPVPQRLHNPKPQTSLRSPLYYDDESISAHSFPSPPPLFTPRSNSQPGVQRSPRSPRPLPIIGVPDATNYQQQPNSFVNYSLPASHSAESIPETPRPGARNRPPYQAPLSPPRSNTTSPPSSTSGTPAPSFVSFRSRDTEHTYSSTIQTSPPASHLSPSPSSSSATIDNVTMNAPARPASVSSGSHSSGRDSQSSGRGGGFVNKIKPPSLRSSSSRDPGFVFPSGRSRAAPNSPTRFKFKSKRKKEKERATAAEQQAQLRPVPAKFAQGFSEAAPRSNSQSSNNRTPTVHSSSSSDASSQGFVFPQSRSRAHPDPAKKLKNGGGGRSSGETTRSPESDITPSSSRFMGIGLKKKKNTKRANGTPTTSEGLPLSPSYEEEFDNQQLPDSPGIGRYDSAPQHPTLQQQREKSPIPRYAKKGTYPLDPYDSVLLECDRQTGELVRQLNGSATPSFFPYGTNPPATILDLGCGQGHWMLDAAISWKGYGAKVTGIDIVDISKNLRMLAMKHGVAENITFIKTNFLQKRLPFADESFDLVRMSCLTLAIPFDRWEFVLQEVRRVLTVGGRLELIDDHIFFAYGKSPLSASMSSPSDPTGPAGASVPRLDISIPSPRMSTISSMAPPSSWSGTTTRSAGAGPSRPRNDDESELYALYEDDDGADTATIHGGGPTSPLSPSLSSISTRTPSIIQSINPDIWSELASSSKELEALFEHMLNMKYGIHLCPSEFLVGMMERVFGYSREMDTMHLTLASPYEGEDVPTSPGDPKSPTSPAAASGDSINQLLHAPGLILWPSTFIPMPQRDVEAHALKHNKTLLSTKLALVEYAVEIDDEGDVEDEGVKEALWDYDNFLHQRFNPPPISDSPISSGASAARSINTLDSDDNYDQATISGLSITDRQSIFSMSSVTSEGRDAMMEYGSDIRHHFGWQDPGSSSSSRGGGGQPSIHAPMTAPLQIPERRTANQSFRAAGAASSSSQSAPASMSSPGLASSSPPPPVARRDSALTVTSPPNYSRFEPTHVRTFHIYEAIKMEETLPEHTGDIDDDERSELPYS